MFLYWCWYWRGWGADDEVVCSLYIVYCACLYHFPVLCSVLYELIYNVRVLILWREFGKRWQDRIQNLISYYWLCLILIAVSLSSLSNINISIYLGSYICYLLIAVLTLFVFKLFVIYIRLDSRQHSMAFCSDFKTGLLDIAIAKLIFASDTVISLLLAILSLWLDMFRLLILNLLHPNTLLSILITSPNLTTTSQSTQLNICLNFLSLVHKIIRIGNINPIVHQFSCYHRVKYLNWMRI